MKLTAYGQTDVGRMRSNNEDCFYLDEQRGLFIVADGMGGHAAGEIASKMAVDTVCEAIESKFNEQMAPEELQPLLAAAVTQANRSISQAAAENPTWHGMGTTLTVLLLHARQAFLTHVGDSRLYRWRNKTLTRLSDDHTLIDAQLRRGIISEREASQSDLRNILLQAVGITEELDICQKTLPTEPGDCFLLCSDGLTDMLSQESISEILTSSSLPQTGCRELMAAALAAGGRDNITAVLVTVDNK